MDFKVKRLEMCEIIFIYIRNFNFDYTIISRHNPATPRNAYIWSAGDTPETEVLTEHAPVIGTCFTFLGHLKEQGKVPSEQ